ncbi:hypothetical protein L2E82_28555 [Cichorium intybus]|uniref:Uncharacterized protein n=1 Tax=Cichorium intybus TaxID=13427 RepID=A0ACB9CWF0_CICIN|nr:hypothetical protein L2E82_28555 [Cichorium intybus]
MDFSRITLLTGTCDGSTTIGVGKSSFSEKFQEIGSKCDDIMLQDNNQDEIMSIGDTSSISLPITVAIKGIDKGQIVAEVISVGKEAIESAIGHTLVVLADKNHRKSVRSVLELECREWMSPTKGVPNSLPIVDGGGGGCAIFTFGAIKMQVKEEDDGWM